MTGEFLDPDLEQIFLAAAKAAATAVGGMVVRSSAAAWKEVSVKYRPAPSKVRRSSSWKQIKLAKKQGEEVLSFLNSRSCQGLLEILAYLHYQDQQVKVNQEELDKVKEAFVGEYVNRVSGGEDRAGTALRLWQILSGSVSLHVRALKRKEAFSSEDAMLYARLMERPRDEKTKRSLLPQFIADRAAVSTSYDRSVIAFSTIGVIRSATAKIYETILMPQVRDDHQIPIRDIYIDRNLRYRSAESILRRGEGVVDEEENPCSEMPETAIIDRRLAIIGNPGAGKSTFVRHLMYSVSTETNSAGPAAPMIVELKNYATITETWTAVLAKRLSITVQEEVAVQTVHDILALGNAIVVFDGLDEIGALEQRRQVVRTIQQFACRYPLVQIVVTSREEGFLGARLDSTMFPVYQLPDFTEEQVSLYAARWFKIVNRLNLFDPEERTSSFLRDSSHVHDLRTNPLLLALLCAIYDYDGYIPENRPSIYQQCADLLLERWDRQRGVQISFKTTMEIRYLIQELAYHFFSRQSVQSGETEIGLKALIRDYVERQVTGDRILAQSHAEEFLDYCAGRAWVLSRVGRNDRGERLFGFTHRTFMEYFAACYIVRHNGSAVELVGRLMPMIESGASDVVPQIAIQELNVRMADGIDDCLSLIVFGSVTVRRTLSKAGLVFAVRSLHFMRPTPRVLKEILKGGVRRFSVEWDVDLVAYLLQVPVTLRQSLVDVCEDLASPDGITDRSSARVAAAAAIVSAYVDEIGLGTYLGAFKDYLLSGRGSNIGAKVSGSLKTRLHGNIAASREAYLAGYLEYRDYVDMVPPKVIFEGPGLPSTRGVYFDALLGQVDSNLFYSDVEKMQRLFLRSPSVVFPLGEGIVHELMASSDRWAVSIDRMSISPVYVGDKSGFLLGLAVMCVCWERGWDWTGLSSQMMLDASGVDDFSRMIEGLRSETFVPVVWRKVFKMWIRGAFRFGVES